MKKISLLSIILFLSTAGFAQKYATFGEKISPKNAISIDQLKSDSEKNSNVKVYGEVESVCEVKGCWMKLKLTDGSTMRVTFKDYGFFVPKDIAGKKVIIEGDAKVRETSVEELKHYAEDAGKSKAEIAKITVPKTELTFVANGVLLEK